MDSSKLLRISSVKAIDTYRGSIFCIWVFPLFNILASCFAYIFVMKREVAFGITRVPSCILFQVREDNAIDRV
jgi:hypothetical protein